MRPLRTLRLIWTFYKSFYLISILLTICCLVFFREFGLGVFTTLIWFKIATLGLTFYFIHSYKDKEYYYYQNLGISKRLLWITTLSFDFALFILLIIENYQFKLVIIHLKQTVFNWTLMAERF